MSWPYDWRPWGKATVRRGTPPTPEDPAPSNQTIREYPNGISIISTGRPTRKVLAEYEAAIAADPDDAGLHLHYGMSLKHAGRNEQAMSELTSAIRLDPASALAHSFFSDCLKDAGRLEEAIHEQREALRLGLAESQPGREQLEAISRWGLGELLAQTGHRDEARVELERAVAVQREALSQGAGSRQLLGQIERALRRVS